MSTEDSLEAPKHAGGRPSTKFIEAHFKKQRYQDNKAKKWIVTCNYCTTELIHRDNRCANHIANRKECPEAPEFARQQALQKLVDTKQSGSVNSEEILKNSQDDDTRDTGPSKPTKRIRREDAKLTAYLEKPLDQSVQDELDMRLIR